jgi:hypothetical protein
VGHGIVHPLSGEMTLRASCLSALWQIYETIVSPSQGTGLMVLSMGDRILTHSSVPYVPRTNTFTASLHLA